MSNINYNDFRNICRTCLINCDIKFTQDSVILDIFFKLTGCRFETNDELPKQICLKCFEKMNDIFAFALQCKQTQCSLIKCLTNHKKNQNMFVKKEAIVPETTNSKIEFISIKQETVEDTFVDETFNFNLTDDEDDEVPPITHIKTEPPEDVPVKTEPPEDVSVKTEPSEDVSIKTEPPEDAPENMEFDETSRSIDSSNSNEDTSKETDAENSKKRKKETKEYKCNSCDKTFNFLSSYNDHKIVHSSERPYECDVCSKGFKLPRTLLRHKRLHSGDRPYVCHICNKAFKSSSNLTSHALMHSSERRYECDVCPKTFKLSGDLIRHKRIHSGERPYQCDICSKTFIESNKLNRHKKMHGQMEIKNELDESFDSE